MSGFDPNSKNYWIALTLLCFALMILYVVCPIWVSDVSDALTCGIFTLIVFLFAIPVLLYGAIMLLFRLRETHTQPSPQRFMNVARAVFGMALISFSMAFETLWQIDPVTFAILFAAGLLMLIDTYLQTRPPREGIVED